MKLLVVPWGRNLGHVMRCLSVVTEAAKQPDIEAMIALPQRWRETVGRIGARLLSYPEELTAMPAWENWQQLAHLRRSLQADLELLQQAQPDVVLHDIRPTMLLACQLLDIPCIAIGKCHQYPGFLFPGEKLAEPVWRNTTEVTNQLLGEYGLPPVKEDLRELLYRRPIIIPSVPEFDPVPADQVSAGVAAQLWYTGPLLWSEGVHSDLPLFQGTEVPPVIFVYGVISRQHDLDALVATFRETPFHLLVTGAPPEVRVPTRAERVSLYPLVDVTTVLPRCTAAITHSAHGSCLATLSAGLPVAALSGPYQEYERTHNGRLLEKMGVGRRLPGVVGWRRVREAVELITSEPSYREKARKWQQYFKRWPGSPLVVEILRGLATGEQLPPPFFSPEYCGPKAFDEEVTITQFVGAKQV